MRDSFSGLSHLITAFVAAAGLGVLLYLTHTDLPRLISSLVYGLSLVLMFAASGIYHLVNARPSVIQALRKFDHSAIYLLIAGTYTPIAVYFFDGGWRLGILITVWSMALIGIGIKIFFIKAPRWLTAGVYLVMGWVCIVAIQEMLTSLPVGALVGLLIGGLMFSVGAVVYIFKKPDFFPGVFGFHEVWHIFVILGALSHYLVVLKYVGGL